VLGFAGVKADDLLGVFGKLVQDGGKGIGVMA
jgi:hypothetical protein